MEQEGKTRKPWNKLLIVELLLPLLNYCGFALMMLSAEGGWPDWCGMVGSAFYWGSAVLVAVGVLALPFQIWKRRHFSLTLLIVTAVVNVAYAVLLAWFWSGQVFALGV